MSSTPGKKTRIAIIGGGLSGLATAVFLHRWPKIEVTLFEASGRFGGVIDTEKIGGFLVDHGADMFATQPDAAVRLCEQLGVQNELIQPRPERRGAKILRNGKCVAIPEGFVLMRATRTWPMMTTPLLSPMGKLRFLAERWIAPRPLQSPDDTSLQDESVADFVTRRMGHEVLDRIVAPLAAGIYTADVTKLSMRATMGPIFAMEEKHSSLWAATRARRRSGEDSVERVSTGARYGQFRAFAGGMKKLIEHLVAALPASSLKTEVTIKRINKAPSGWMVTTQSGSNESFDQVVIATPAKAAAKLLSTIVNPSLGKSARKAASELDTIESASAAIVVLGVRAADIKRPAESFGIVVPLSANRNVLAVSFASHKFSGRAPDDHVLIRTFVGGAMQSELLSYDDDQLVELVRDELSDIIGLVGTPVISKVVRWNDAMPQYHVGHGQIAGRVDRVIDSIEGLSLVGNALHGVGIAPLIAQAQRKAKSIVDSVDDRSANRVS